MTEAVLRLVLGDGISGLAQAQQRLTSFLTSAGCDAQTRFHVELVVEEVVMNILHHGQPDDRPAQSWLEAWPTPGHVAIMVEDDGPEFDPLQVVSAPLAERLEEAAIGGHGISLVRKYAAGLRYTRTSAGRNRLEFKILRTG